MSYYRFLEWVAPMKRDMARATEPAAMSLEGSRLIVVNGENEPLTKLEGKLPNIQFNGSIFSP